MVIVERAVMCGILGDDACCFCGMRPQSWHHLLYERRHMEVCRAGFVECPGDGVPARDTRQLCRNVLDDLSVLPRATALYGILVELGADYTQHWWHVGAAVSEAGWRSAVAGALPAQAYPDLDGGPTSAAHDGQAIRGAYVGADPDF
jgi:hypothetical protein